MTIGRAPALDIGQIIERSDFWRRSPASAGGAPGHKEWSYFSVLDEQVQLVLVFSIMDRPCASPSMRPRIEEARVTVLARARDGSWSGDIEACEPAAVAICAGRVNARFGASDLTFAEGAYRLRLRLGEPGAAAADLVLRPVARPALTRSVPLGTDNPMHWFVVPRLEAAGTLHVGGRVHVLRGSPAYHDHNWGRFTWGGDFAWEWGTILSASPGASWSLVYYRITDRGRHAVIAQGLLLWCGDRHHKTFRDADLVIRSEGLLRSAGCVRLPRVMRLIVPGAAGDLPRRLTIAARSGSDALDLVLDIDDCGQICLPHDSDDGITTVSECHARASVAGRLNGSILGFECGAIVEFNRAAV
jgi:hypothetical protein